MRGADRDRGHAQDPERVQRCARGERVLHRPRQIEGERQGVQAKTGEERDERTARSRRRRAPDHGKGGGGRGDIEHGIGDRDGTRRRIAGEIAREGAREEHGHTRDDRNHYGCDVQRERVQRKAVAVDPEEDDQPDRPERCGRHEPGIDPERREDEPADVPEIARELSREPRNRPGTEEEPDQPIPITRPERRASGAEDRRERRRGPGEIREGAFRGGVGKDLLADEHRDRADHGDGVCTDGPARGEVANEVPHVMDARPRPIPFGRPRTYRSAPSRGTRTGEIGPLSPDRVTTSEWASVSAGDPTARPHDLRRARLPRRGDPVRDARARASRDSAPSRLSRRALPPAALGRRARA